MPSFTPEQQAFIRQVAFEVAPIILKRHVESCPWGQKMRKFIWVGIGIGITLSLLGITTIPQLVGWLAR